jgi:hypothetical protein
MSHSAKQIKPSPTHSEHKPNSTQDQLISPNPSPLDTISLPEIEVRPVRTPLAKTPYGKEHLYEFKETAILPQISKQQKKDWKTTLKKAAMIGLPFGVVSLLFGARVAFIAIQETNASTFEILWLALKF